MPDNKDYISNTYNAIKEKVEGFNRTPEEYRKLMSTDSKYRQNVYNTLKDKVEGFERTPQEFDSLIIGKPQKEVTPKAEEKFGPLPAKTTISPELPSFAQQQEQVRAPLKYGQAAARDRSETGKLLATTWNNFVGGAESYLAGAIARGAGASPYAGQQAMIEAARTGKTKTAGEVIKEAKEAPKKQAAIEKEAYKKIEELTGAIKSDYVTPEEAQGISEIDFTNRSFADNAKALFASGGRLAFDIPAGIATGGTSYYLQSYGESVRDYDRMVEKGQLETNPLAREFYGNTVGLVSAALEKFAIDKIFGAGPALKNIQKKAIANVFGKIAKSTTPLSAKATEKLVEAEIRALSANIKARGAKTVYSSAVEGGTEGLQTAMTEGAKIITNKIQGQEVYDEKEIVDNIGKNIFNASVAGGIYGVPMGAVATFGKNVNSSVLKDIAEAKTDEDFAKIDNDLEEVFVANNYSPEEREAVSTTVKNYARIKQKLPPLTPPEVQEKVIPLIEQRDKIDEELTAKKESTANLDEAVAADEVANIEMLEAKRASINDEIRSEVAGTEFTYFEQDGKFFKQLGENQPEEITKARFDIESIRQEDKQLAQDEEDAPTVLDMMDKPVIINGERATLTQEGQTVIAKVLGKERIIEVGNIDEIGNQKLSDVGLAQEESAVTIGDTGNIVVRGTEFVNLFTDPLAAINRDDNGNIVSVNLETADGKKRTFRGATADDVSYQIILKNITENNETRQQFEDFVEANEPIKQELESGQVAETAVEAAPVATEQVPVVAEIKVGSIVTDADGKEYTVLELGTSRKGTPQATVEIPKRTKEEIEQDARRIVFNRGENRGLYKSENDPKFIKEQAIPIQQEISEQTAIERTSTGTTTLDLADLKLKTPAQTVVAEEVVPTNEVEILRAEEQKELLAAIPNIEQYKVDGVVDRTKITNEKELAKFDEIYNKYDKLITPLLEPSQDAKPVEVVEEQKAEEKPAEKKPKMVTQTGLLAPANGRVVMVGEANPDFQNATIVLGEDTTIEMPNGETRDATFAVVEMDDILASHDENSFNDTDGYPSQNGMNANPRNYKTDAVAMDKVNRDANNLKPSIVISDSATPDTGVPIITTDGIVVSGNGRTMAIKLSERIAPEKYAEYRNNLEKRAAKFGIDAAEVKKMRNPVLIKMDTKIKEYSIKELDAYNQKAQKGESPVDKAIKRAGIITANQRLKDGILRIIEGYNTMSELFDNKADRSAIIDLFEANGIITAQERSEYVGANKELTEDGKDLVNDVLIATIISPEVMRATDNVKSFKKNIVNALPLLTENYRNKDYSLEELINNAILLQSDMVSRGYKLNEFYDFVSQIQMGRPHNPDVVVMNRMIAEGPNKFKEFVRKYNVAAETSEGGMFASEALTREQALGQLAKTEDKISENERKIIASLAGIYAEYERGQQAGTAKVFEQPIVEQVTEQEAEDFPEFVNGQFTNPKFEQQYQDEKTTAFGFTETREQYVARKFC